MTPHPFRIGQTVNLRDEPSVDLVIEAFVTMLAHGGCEWVCVVSFRDKVSPRKFRIPAEKLRPAPSEARRKFRVIKGGKHA